jgi:hypothetical protein
VSMRSDLRRVAPWVLCAVALGLMGLAQALRSLAPGQATTADVNWLEGAIGALGFAGIPLVGALIASRPGANVYGWLWCAAGLAYGVSDVARSLVRFGWPEWGAWILGAWGFVSLLGLMVFIFLLFPTGHLPSERWRWPARAAVTGVLLLTLAAAMIADPDDPSAASPWALQGAAARELARIAEVGVAVMFGLVLAAMFSLVLRFRRAGPTERRQLTWFLYAAAVNGALLLVDALGLVPAGLVAVVLSSVAFALLPLAVGIAMLRYRLYEIDKIVSRTVSYGLLTGGLVALYLLLVTLLRALLEPLTGNSNLAVAASTLAVAAVFNPVRRRVQDVVDRRFDRARYDAARAVDDFTARLRDQVDLDEVTTGLCDTVVATVAPTRVAVWLRTPSGMSGARP